jgi:hypothetical protein
MSTLKVNNLNNVAGDTAVSLSGGSLVASDIKTSSINSGPITGFRNRIINGGMDIDQRNAGNSVSLNNTSSYTVDRWQCSALGGSGTGTATVQRVADAPPGFAYSLKYTVTNAKSPAPNDAFYIFQPIEGQNVMDFAFGTSSAKTVTLSFWVKSSLTGTFSGFLRSYNGSSYRSYIFNYTINSANTWQYFTVIAPGDVGQTLSTDNTQGFGILFDLGSGSNFQSSTINSWVSGGTYGYFRSTSSINFISTLNATFQITGVQFEVGTTATPFERRAFGQELILCQRYFEKSYDDGVSVGTATTNGVLGGTVYYYNGGNQKTSTSSSFRVTKRAQPTLTFYDTAGNSGAYSNFINGTTTTNYGAITVLGNGCNGFHVYSTNFANSMVYHFTASAEL